MKQPKRSHHPQHNKNSTALIVEQHEQTEKIEQIEKRMMECRNTANDVLPDSDYKLYLQRVGKYAYLRWRGNGAVISTRAMKKIANKLPATSKSKLYIDSFNFEAEKLNLKYSMLLKIQQTTTEDC